MAITVFNEEQLTSVAKKYSGLSDVVYVSSEETSLIPSYSYLVKWSKITALDEIKIEIPSDENLEIVFCVLEGGIEYYDSTLEIWESLHEGDAQILHAGKNINHTEKILKNTIFFKILFKPEQAFAKEKQSFKTCRSENFPITIEQGRKIKTYCGQYSPMKNMHTDLKMLEIEFSYKIHRININPKAAYSFVVLEGKMETGTKELKTGDFCYISGEEQLILSVRTDSKIFMIEATFQA